VALLDRWNWWLPHGAARVLRIRPSQRPLDVTPEAAPASA
jgi:hypothetical protein